MDVHGHVARGHAERGQRAKETSVQAVRIEDVTGIEGLAKSIYKFALVQEHAGDDRLQRLLHVLFSTFTPRPDTCVGESTKHRARDLSDGLITDVACKFTTDACGTVEEHTGNKFQRRLSNTISHGLSTRNAFVKRFSVATAADHGCHRCGARDPAGPVSGFLCSPSSAEGATNEVAHQHGDYLLGGRPCRLKQQLLPSHAFAANACKEARGSMPKVMGVLLVQSVKVFIYRSGKAITVPLDRIPDLLLSVFDPLPHSLCGFLTGGGIEEGDNLLLVVRRVFLEILIPVGRTGFSFQAGAAKLSHVFELLVRNTSLLEVVGERSLEVVVCGI